MEQEHDNQFTTDVTKHIPAGVALTKWAPNMDLLAIATFENTIELFRISYKAQRVFQTQQAKPIKFICFSLDSQLIAYGLLDGSIKIIKTQNGQKIIIIDNLHSSQIETLTFINYCSVNPKSFMPFQKQSIEAKLILNISPHKNCNKYFIVYERNAIIKINYFNQLKKEFMFLLSSERKKTWVLLNGFIPLAQINYKQTKIIDFKVLHSYYDQKIMSIIAEQKMQSFGLNLIEYQAKQLIQYQQDIVKFNSLSGYVTEILNFVEGTYSAMEIQIKDIMRQYNSKINLIDDPNIENINPCQQLYRFLNLGITSSALINFFSKELYDSKIPQKLDETLTSLFTNLHELILQSTQNSLQRVIILLHNLANMSHTQRFKIFGLKSVDLDPIISQITKLYTMTEILLVESTEAKFDIRNLLVWCNKSSIKTSQQNDVEIQNTKSYLNKYTVDFTRLHNFLSNENKFKLQNLNNFFNNQQSTTQMKYQQPEFKLFNKLNAKKQNPELQANYKRLQKLLQVDDIVLPQQKKQKLTFQSFKKQMIECKQLWNKIVSKPIHNMSELITRKYTLHKIGQVQFNQLFPFEIKTIIRNNQLFVYYVERTSNIDMLIEYNCHKKIRKYLYTSKFHIISIAVAAGILLVLQQKLQNKRIIAEVSNTQFDGKQIIIGKQVTRIEGQVDIDCSLRNLNCMIVNKNDLTIFQ